MGDVVDLVTAEQRETLRALARSPKWIPVGGAELLELELAQLLRALIRAAPDLERRGLVKVGRAWAGTRRVTLITRGSELVAELRGRPT